MTMNYMKYVPYPGVNLQDRQWPSKVITQAPIWCSVDLRDGNQALDVPMSVDEKVRLFEMLVKIGFKQIEVGFPSASATEFAFVRKIIEEKRIPDDVVIQILTQARKHLIERSFEALEGVNQANVHVYNSTSVLQRKVVFRKDREEIKGIAVQGAQWVREFCEAGGNSGIRFQYSPESFTGTEMDYALEVCHAVLDVWEPTPEQPAVINLPATVEMCTPNIYADQIEWCSRNMQRRDSVQLSIHPHNDRGTAVAASELALMAGADRVEGTLFGNGKRTGNLDLVTMALNMFSQGIDPRLDLSDINAVRETYEVSTRMRVHPRHPYAGDLVYTAFSGSHQDAINKGMKAYRDGDGKIWEVPYLPIDPCDVGRTYESIIRINSQSGKGGVAYIMEDRFGYRLPKKMQPEFAKTIQRITDETGEELVPEDMLACFENEYLKKDRPFHMKTCRLETDIREVDGKEFEETLIKSVVRFEDVEHEISGCGNGPIDAFVQAIREKAQADISLEYYTEHAMQRGADAKAVAYIQLCRDGFDESFGVGIDSNIDIASIKAILSAMNRLWG